MCSSCRRRTNAAALLFPRLFLPIALSVLSLCFLLAAFACCTCFSLHRFSMPCALLLPFHRAMSLLIFTCAHRSLALCFALRFICIAISVSDNITIVTALLAPLFFLRFSRWAILCCDAQFLFIMISLLLHGNPSQCCFNSNFPPVLLSGMSYDIRRRTCGVLCFFKIPPYYTN